LQINLIILIALAAAALWTVMTRSLLRSGIGLALTSAILTIIMFRLSSPLAAVFELSVCAGLISVLFISTISLTEAATKEEKLQHMKDRLSRFWYLPFIIIIGGIVLSLLNIKPNFQLPMPEAQTDVRQVMWNVRQIDLLGQIIILLAGVFGVVIFFKGKTKNG
jgi:NADH-quinone oxidoreductase subunit J